MQAPQRTANQAPSGLAGKYLTFQLGNEIYGLEILKVREIIGLMDVTPVPRTPSHIRGVINLRGKIIPVIDLRSKFAMEKTADTEQTCIIVVDLVTADVTSQMGILVDAVSEVLNIADESIEPTPSFGGEVTATFIRGMAKTNGKVAILLNVEKVLSTDGVLQIAATAATAVTAAVAA